MILSRVTTALLLVAGAFGGACGDDGSAAAPASAAFPGVRPAPTVDPAVPAPLVLPLITPPFDVVSTSGAIEAWPRLAPGVEARAITSHDRTGGNNDGFSGTYSELTTDERGEHVIFDAIGPGALRTLWFTSDIDGNGPLPVKKVRFYLDDEREPRIEVDGNALYTGVNAPFVHPLVADNQISSGGFASWSPIVFAKRLRITTEERPGFYQAHYETFPVDWDVRSTRAGETEAALVDRFTKTGFSELALTVTPLDTSRTGAGTIDVVRFEPTTAPSNADLQNARIRIWFDGATQAQVDVPLGMFFGSGLGEAKIRAVPWTMDPGRYEARFPMPYWEGFRIAVSGLAGQLSLHVAAPRFPRLETGTFEAIFHEAKPTTPGADVAYADVVGAGKLVGTVLAIVPLAPAGKQWWEGDLRSVIDDLRTPGIHGTGHEDDHLGGWSNEFLERPFTQPMQGCPKTELIEHLPGTQYNANATMYRLYPGIPFWRHLRHSTEHGPQNAREANYAAATFLYRQPRQRLVKSGAVVVEGAGAEALTSRFDGEHDDELTATSYAYARPITFRLAIARENQGVKLRRLFDQKAGGQRARVEVDGYLVGTWYVPEANATRRWAERDFFVPPQVTRGKRSLSFTLVPEGPLHAARFETWSVLP